MIQIKKGISAQYDIEDQFYFTLGDSNPFNSAFVLKDDFAFTKEYLIEKEEDEYVLGEDF